MARTAAPSLDLYRDEVENAIEAGAAFPTVAEAIGQTDFSHDDKSTLWVIAWTTADMQHRNRDKATMLRLLRDAPSTPGD